jgi:di/tricarboxylate transporter
VCNWSCLHGTLAGTSPDLVRPREPSHSESYHLLSWQSLQVVIVLAVVLLVIVGMVRERMPADLVAICGSVALIACGVLKTNDLLKVFSNPAPFTVACLFVLSAALDRTGVINGIGSRLARVPWRSPQQALLVVMLLCLLHSVFTNNTAMVVIMTPVVIQLAHSLGTVPSRMLMPLSFATILGGTCSLIGTSTNIVVDGVAQSHGLPPFRMFEITAAGAIYGVIGVLYLHFIGCRLLPERPTLSSALIDLSQRKFLTEVLLPHGSTLIGRTLDEAGLTRNRGFTVVDFVRDGESIEPAADVLALAAGDRLVLRTGAADVVELRESGEVVLGAGAPQALEKIATKDARMMEGIVGPRSSFAGRRVAELDLRRLFEVRILAIHRRNENLQARFPQVRLAFGDTILLEGPTDGLKRLFEGGELINLTEVTERPFRRRKAWIAVLAVIAVMLLSAFEILPIAGAALMAVTAVILLGCVDPEEAYRAVNWPILMLIFGMMGIGTAMETSGAGALIVHQMVALVGSFGPVFVLSMVYFLTSCLTECMSHNAAALLITPIAIAIAQQMGVDPRPFVVAVMFAASASFATPIGYATNTLVYAAGGYKFIDFVKVGLPLNILLWLVATVIIPLFWPVR